MRVEHYIAELLYRYNCVMVPQFGAFLANKVGAQIDLVNNTLYPPAKVLSFNESLTTNDGLLVSHMANAKKIPYEEMLNLVLNTTKNWSITLDSGKELVLEGIGKLWLGEERKIQFEPDTGCNYLSSSFGFSSFTATPVLREVLKEEVKTLEERIPFTITPEQRTNLGSKTWLKYAAMFLLMVATGASAYQMNRQQLLSKEIARQEAHQQVSRLIQEATFFEGEPIELPLLQLTVNSNKTKNKHHIIAGAFRFKENADKKVRQLINKGFKAIYLGTNANGLHQVAYASYENAGDALKKLREIKSSVSADAWLLSEK